MAAALVFCVSPLQAAEQAGAAPAPNPLLAPWSGPYGGVPPFDKIRPALFLPALEITTRQARREIEAIAADPRPPTFENTVLAFVRAGEARGRVLTLSYVWGSSRNDAAMREVQTAMAPRLAAFDDEVVQNPRLFRRVEAVSLSDEMPTLSAEQQRLVKLTLNDFVLSGARLDDAGKRRMAQINTELAALTTRFGQNLLADEEEQVLVIDRRDGLDGLDAQAIEAAAAEARRRGLRGRWAIANTRSAMEPFLTLATSRTLRERGFKLWAGRGDHPDPKDPRHAHDNNPLVLQILALRAERSRLLGFPSYAHWSLADAMAKEPARAMDLLMQVWKPATQAAQARLAAMQAIADAEGRGVRIEPWDHRYYAELLRRSQYDFDVASLRPYLQLERIREAMFWMAGELYGLRFTPARGVPVFDRAMSVYEVRGRDGQHVGLWYFDPYARPGKSSGAWMNSFRMQGRLNGDVRPLVSNNCNFIPGRRGEPTLISWEDAVTMFHEFGHALHGLLSNVTHPSLASPNSAAGFGEVPSQIHEKWLETPQIQRFLVDREGRTMPPELLDRMRRAAKFNRGFTVTEYLASAIVDLQLHMSEQPVTDLAAVEAGLSALGLPHAIVMRHRIPQFQHIFSGEPGYAAGYYTYQWASVLDRDAYEAFTETGNPFDPATARRLVDTMLSVGNAVDPADAFRAFRGRDPDVGAVLRDNGFAPAPTPP